MGNLSDSNSRMERLSRREGDVDSGLSYTRFVRIMRLVLPFAAIVVMAILYLRSGKEDNAIMSIEDQEIAQELKEKTISRNELVNPKFESTDKKNQPYSITADRALQGEVNKDLIMLEKPVGHMTMVDGDVVKVSSNSGAYRQDTERFFLEGNVHLEHVQGYTLSSSEAHIDLKQYFAWSEEDVYATGPDIAINAKGVKANGQTGEIIFQGPARLVLENGFEGVQ